MAENAFIFISYSKLQNVICRATHRPTKEKLPLHLLALAAGGSGAITSFLVTPIELVKCKMQVQMLVTAPQNLPGPVTVLRSVIRMQGISSLWLGHNGTLIRETGGTAAWFCTKEFVASLLLAHRLGREAGPPRITPLGICSFGGVAFNLSLFPADSVKSAIQTEEELRLRNPRTTCLGGIGKTFFLADVHGYVPSKRDTWVVCRVWDNGCKEYTEQRDYFPYL